MPRKKTSTFGFDWTQLEQLARDKTGLTMPAAIEETGTSPQNYYRTRKAHRESVPMVKSILETCQQLGLSLNEFRSLFIEIK